MSQRRQCRMCNRAAQPGSAYCCTACERREAHQNEREPERETVECGRDIPLGALWVNGQRLALQNSA